MHDKNFKERGGGFNGGRWVKGEAEGIGKTDENVQGNATWYQEKSKKNTKTIRGVQGDGKTLGIGKSPHRWKVSQIPNPLLAGGGDRKDSG